ncbi:right-handed parallel beta-helix repeat-containing protein [Leptothoe sp. PORK10 BA2]|uniref:right-handed parallel beta-helix repeat-containing protein n=1 Tax=Leptothoe sp. PORK10 BA2 TaxID=3110254 RepID=UPI002B1F72D5|nr:right-handed parallel beta-helix repeat-containing protein [Leptothoe sp. PORK10 BA2]MEA5465959.1 right-handed parallel beta-helix repeat-containing protein [Leptothoe sp. PORK10 BA2]
MLSIPSGSSHHNTAAVAKVLLATSILIPLSPGLTLASEPPKELDSVTEPIATPDLAPPATAPTLWAQTLPAAPPAISQPAASPSVRFSQQTVQSEPAPADMAPADMAPADMAPAEPVQTSPAPSLSAADLLEVPSRFGVNASTATNGFGETIGVHGFIPLDQAISEDLNQLDVTFLEGDLQVNDGDPSFSLNLGHRGYRRDAADPDNEGYIRGGYVGVDGRFTDNSNFFQLATGYEHINDDWEFRINGYLPIGERTNTIQSVDFDTGLVTNSGFEANKLVLSAIRERQRILQQEDALGGFDAEVGIKLDDWDGGELMGYAGGYLLSGEESSLGGQLRIAANFESNFNAGLSLQHDGLFGTTVALSVSATWPEFRFQDNEEAEFADEYEVPIRLRDSIARRHNVAVNTINESEIIYEEQIEPLRNPEEEEDYRFIHVDLAAGGGDGTYEAPFGTVADAIALINSDATTYSDGNTIVYVDGEAAPATTIPGFTIPERVRVLSQGPEQIIAGMEFPGFPSTATRLPFSSTQNFNVSADDPNANGITVSLPDSNDGVFPLITGGALDLVTLGERTVLAGFQIDAAAQHGVTGNDIDNVELRNNLITNSGGSGIFLNDVGGSAILFDNVINNSADRGIFVENTATDRPLQVTIAGFDLDNNQVGIDFSTIATAGAEVPSQIIAVGPSTTANTSVGTPGGTPLTNSILNSTAEGLVLRAEGDALTGASTQQLSVVDTTIDMSGADGLQIIADVGVHQQEFTFDSGFITNSGGNGITIVNGDTAINGSVTAATPDGASPQEIVILNSEIANNALDGINITLLDAGAQELVIQGNQIINNGGDGIDSIAQTASVQEWRTDGDLGISGNTITGNGGQAITIDLENVAVMPILGIGDNTISGNGATPDIEINTLDTLPAGTVNACLVFGDNGAVAVQITAPDPILNTGIPSVLVQDLPTLIADANYTFLVENFLLGTLSPGTAAYGNETGSCIQ